MFWFDHQLSKERGEWGRGTGVCSLRSQKITDLWLHVEEETAASND